MDQRAAIRHEFAASVLGLTPDSIERASEDASFRSYWRVQHGSASWILMDAPPDREDCRPFIEIGERLAAAGLHPPGIHGKNLEHGLLLLEDLGNTLFADVLSADTAPALYGEALAMLRAMATMDTDDLPTYDAARLADEMALFPDWYLAQQLEQPSGPDFLAWWKPLGETLIESAREQPQVFVHRDFHCGNLMQLPDGAAIIDFQDAVRGPITYDLVSLLLDRYVTWPRAQLETWAERHRQAVSPETPPDTWLRWLDWMGLQRNLKIVGIFARLKLRDGKPQYLNWQPRFLDYVTDTARRYAEFEPLTAFLDGLESKGGRHR